MALKNNEEKDPDFLFSLNLMVLGGLLLLFFIITANKLANHYFVSYPNHSPGILSALNKQEAGVFDVRNEGELHLFLIAFALSLIGLIVVIHQLVKTWNN